MILVGVDPGEKTGICYYDPVKKKIQDLVTVKPNNFLRMIEVAIREGYIFYIEDSRKQSHVWSADGKSKGSANKIARDVGRIDMICSLAEDKAKDYGVPIHFISPLKKGAKLSGGPFEVLTGWSKRSNQHERDAAMLVFGKVI